MQSGILSKGSISSFVKTITLPTLHVLSQVSGQALRQVLFWLAAEPNATAAPQSPQRLGYKRAACANLPER
jgi:hypothetical protein